MKKYFTLLLSLFLIIQVIPNFGSFVAANGYEVACPIYSVDYINDDGTFKNIACYENYEDAKTLMKTNNDYVVRHAEGYAATKIVAMNSGLVYSYPRGSSSTMNIYSDYQDKDKTTTYVQRSYEMTYVDTVYMSSKAGHEAEGYTEVIMNGFHGYVDTEYLDFVPTKFIDNNLSISVGGSYGSNSISPVSVKISPNYYVLNKNGNYLDLEFHYHIAYPNSSGNAYEYTLKVDNGANYNFMVVGTKYFSDDGYNFYSDYHKSNLVGTCYNYYQYLSIRSKTNISGETLDAYLKSVRSDYSDSVINGMGNTYISLGDEYGCNATLFYAMSCQESSYGTSDLAINRNNLFSWKAYDDSPSDASYFSSVDVAIKEHMGRNMRMYADYTDSRYNGTYLGNKGSGFNLKYASDPYWGLKIAALYYSIDKFSCGNNGKLTDHNQYTLALIKNFGTNIYADSNCSSILCTSNYNDYRQLNNIVVIREKNNDVYQIQFSNPIKDNNVIKDCEGVYGYSWSKSVAYIKASDLDILYVTNVDNDLPHDSIININNVTLNGSNLSIKGIGAISNLNFTNQSIITHTITLVDMNDNSKVYSFDSGKYDTNGFSMNDGFNYQYAGFEVNIDLNNLAYSSYFVNITTTCGSITKTTSLKTTENDFRSIGSSDNNKKYRFSANQAYSYRVEIDVLNSPIDYSQVDKPSKRSSLIEYTTPTFNENDSTMTFKGYAMIYYLNYSNADNNRYTLYLVDNNTGNYLEIKMDNIQLEDVIKNQINSVYDINYISFTSTINLIDLACGDYTFVLKVNTADEQNTYTDYLEFVAEGRTTPSVTINNKNYAIHVSDIRNRLMLKVSEV